MAKPKPTDKTKSKPRTENHRALIIQGYTVIQVKGNDKSRAAHCLYLKEHSSPVVAPQWPQGKTLLVFNVPAYCNEGNLELVFKGCGDIKKIFLQPKPASMPVKIKQFMPSPPPNTFKVAYMVFKNANGLKNACKLAYDDILLFSNKETPIHSGLRAYIQKYEDSILDIPHLEQRAEEYLAQYYQNKDEAAQKEKDMEGVPDEDGFIKVTRHGKNKGGRRTEETERKGHEHLKKRKKKNELKDFYTFQFRETKRQHIADLQSKFEEDKKRVQQMKVARKFKPY